MTEGESRRWYSRSDIARELEILAGRIFAVSKHPHFYGDKATANAIGNVIIAHVDAMRGELGAQAEEEARDDIKRREAAGEFVPSVYDAYRQENS